MSSVGCSLQALWHTISEQSARSMFMLLREKARNSLCRLVGFGRQQPRCGGLVVFFGQTMHGPQQRPN